MTATATPEVHEDICTQLGIEKRTRFYRFSRDNLTYLNLKAKQGPFIESYVEKTAQRRELSIQRQERKPKEYQAASLKRNCGRVLSRRDG
ncbi:hypothetical protein PO124_03255 [Bacillus licheniformis]|nr:hypothetical protein [Bacillus licheniformis]